MANENTTTTTATQTSTSATDEKKFVQHDRVAVKGTALTGRIATTAKHAVYSYLYEVEFDKDMGSRSQQTLFVAQRDLELLECKKGSPATLVDAEGHRTAWTILNVGKQYMLLARFDCKTGKTNAEDTVMATPFGERRWRTDEEEKRFVRWGVRLEDEPEAKPEAKDEDEKPAEATDPAPAPVEAGAKAKK